MATIQQRVAAQAAAARAQARQRQRAASVMAGRSALTPTAPLTLTPAGARAARVLAPVTVRAAIKQRQRSAPVIPSAVTPLTQVVAATRKQRAAQAKQQAFRSFTSPIQPKQVEILNRARAARAQGAATSALEAQRDLVRKAVGQASLAEARAEKGDRLGAARAAADARQKIKAARLTGVAIVQKRGEAARTAAVATAIVQAERARIAGDEKRAKALERKAAAIGGRTLRARVPAVLRTPTRAERRGVPNSFRASFIGSEHVVSGLGNVVDAGSSEYVVTGLAGFSDAVKAAGSEILQKTGEAAQKAAETTIGKKLSSLFGGKEKRKATAAAVPAVEPTTQKIGLGAIGLGVAAVGGLFLLMRKK